MVDKITPNDGAATDEFGTSVSLADGFLAVGAQRVGSSDGAAYLFNALTGAQLFKFLPSGSGSVRFFGASIAVDGGIVAVGSPGDNDNGSAAGAAYLFDSGTGNLISKILPADGAPGDNFGISIAMADGIVAIGAYFDDEVATNSGSAYLYDAATGAQIMKLLPNDGASNDRFGADVAIADGLVIVGSDRDDDFGSSSGSTYVFDAATGTQIAKFTPVDSGNGDRFGGSVAIDNTTGTIAIGASTNKDFGINSGYAYLFAAPTVVCLADVNGDGMVSPADFTAWIAAFNAGAPACDQNGDGSCTPTDFTAWIANFNAGCS